MSSLNDELAHINYLIDDRSEFDEALLPGFQKLFPFYVHTNFKVKNEHGATLPRLWCSYCKAWDDEGNGHRTTWFIVFEAPGVVKTLCGLGCKKAPDNLMSFRNQLHGFREPITLPDKFKDSIEHQMVFDIIINQHDWPYWLRKFYPKGIDRGIYNRHIEETMHGGSYKDKNFLHNHDGLALYDEPMSKTNRKKAIELIKPSLIVLTINEIIIEFTNNIKTPEVVVEFNPSNSELPLSTWNRGNFIGDPGPLAKMLREAMIEKTNYIPPEAKKVMQENR